MADPVSSPALAVVALGGNALLRRGEPATAANQLRAARAAAAVLGPVCERTRLVVTHGNGPQVGRLALKEDAYASAIPIGSTCSTPRAGGQIGYVVELELDNAIDHQDTVTVITRVLVDADDPAFEEPTKFIGPVYGEGRARSRSRAWLGRQPRRRPLAPRRPVARPEADHSARRDPEPRRGRFPSASAAAASR